MIGMGLVNDGCCRGESLFAFVQFSSLGDSPQTPVPKKRGMLLGAFHQPPCKRDLASADTPTE